MLYQRIPYPLLTTACNSSTYSGNYIQTTTTACNAAREHFKGALGPTQQQYRG